MTDGNGEATFSAAIAAVVGAGEFITATVTVDNGASFGDTSEFAQNIVVNISPTISLPGSVVNYNENEPAKIIDSTATVTDPDSPDFDTGTLTVSLSVGGTTHDRLAIRNQGIGPSDIGVSGTNVTFGGTVIGTFTGGTDGSTPLVATRNSNATVPAVDALLKNITYYNISDNPSAAARTVQFVLTDGDGGTSNVATETINVLPIADSPIALDDRSGLDFDGVDDYVNIGSNTNLEVSSAATTHPAIRGVNGYVVGTSVVATGALSARFVLWTARAGYLLTMLSSSLPAWASVDPIPVLDEAALRNKSERDAALLTEESLVDIAEGRRSAGRPVVNGQRASPCEPGIGYAFRSQAASRSV